MHSSAIVQNILNIAIETAEEYDADRITEINVEVGKLNWIKSDKLNYIFNILYTICPIFSRAFSLIH